MIPTYTINAISKGEAKQYLRTNSDNKMTQKLADRLIQRGYKYKQILPHIKPVKFNQGRQTLFRQKPTANHIKGVSVTQFCDNAHRLIIANLIKHLEKSSPRIPCSNCIETILP